MGFNKQEIWAFIDGEKEFFCKLADDIWDNPETAFAEMKSAALQIEALKKLGFEVTEELAGIKTAFSGRYGSGKPVIGVLGEFDALSGLSQKADSAMKEAIVPGENGHGCGHNLLGVGAMAAAYGIMKYLKKSGESGTVIYYGCPGEEGGSGKAFMARDGVFDELDCAVTWHPGDTTTVTYQSSLANYQVNYRFTGFASHAAAAPHVGRSALDAVELMNVGVQFLREHVIQEARIHYAITDAGGYSPNVVQPTAEVLYLMRAPRTAQVQGIYERINNIARGAALMTDTQVEITFIKACSDLLPNEVLCRQLQENLELVGVPEYTDEDRAYAAEFCKTMDVPALTDKEMRDRTAAQRRAYKKWDTTSIHECILPFPERESFLSGSTDVGDVSNVCPTAQFFYTTQAAGTPGHSWQFVSQGKSGLAHKGMMNSAKALAGTILDLMEDPSIIQRAKEEFDERTEGIPFVSPIPQGVKPTVMKKK